MFVTITAYAQSCNCKHEIVRYKYIYTKLGNNKEIKIYDGTEEKPAIPNTLIDESGNKIYVRGVDGLRNYFTLQGWEYISENSGVLFLRKVVSEEEAKEMLSKLTTQQD